MIDKEPSSSTTSAKTRSSPQTLLTAGGAIVHPAFAPQGISGGGGEN
jgi:hypothetical protein